LQIAMEALDIGPGDEVVTASYTFVGTVNAIARTGARPVLVDVDPDTLNLDSGALPAAIGPRTRAVLVVHLFGRPAPMEAILALARPAGIAVIEDACEAAGARYRGRPVGGLADVGVFAFYPNKPIATGEGGMIVANDPEFLTRCRRLRNQGVDPLSGTREALRPGHSARLSELHAALGLVQLDRLEASLARRAAIAGQYLEQLGGHPGLCLPPPADPGDRLAWFTFPLRLVGATRAQRDRLVGLMGEQGIECGIYFEPVHRLAYHADQHDGRPLPVSVEAGDRSLALPLYPGLSDAEVQRVARTLLEIAQAL
jgi:perosamine synthetase